MTGIKRAVAGAAFVGAALTAGIGSSVIMNIGASAATPTPTATAPANSGTAPPPGNFDPKTGGHVGANGVKEVLLTGDSAARASAAALAAVPGGTIERVENDAEGATYEAHMTKTDGSRVTVKMDANFKVTGTEAGH